MIVPDSVYLPIRAKIIVPFFVVLLLVGVLGTWLATARLSLAAAAEFDAGLLRASLLANDRLEVLETDRLAQLRAATDTLGVPEAVAGGDRPTLSRLLTPLAGNTAPANLELRVLDRGGHQLLGVVGSVAGPVTLPDIDSLLSPLAPVQDALAGRTDGMGERNVFLDAGLPQPVLYWIGPVWNTRGQAVGAILIGQSVADIARGISGSTFYDGNGTVLSSSVRRRGPSVRPCASRSLPARRSGSWRFVTVIKSALCSVTGRCGGISWATWERP